MKQTYCNPLDLSYRYQHFNDNGKKYANREAADPTLVFFKGMYYMFASMSAGFWHSKDLANWQFHANEDLLIQDYAPDVRQIGEYLYFCASRRGEKCPILRTLDPMSDVFEEVSRPFDFWDPDIFCDDDGRVYFYWGCTNTDPIYGVEMDPETMTPIGSIVPLITEHVAEFGFERPGDDGVAETKENSIVYQHLKDRINPQTGRLELPAGQQLGPYGQEALQKILDAIGKPYIEGAYMTKHQGKYYLQYACPGTQYNTYADGVYVGDNPLGPLAFQQSNPFSAKPGGFIAGAGHGSTIADAQGCYWHVSSMRISKNHSFERRLGLFPAGFDKDGIMYCNQNFADYPTTIPKNQPNLSAIEPVWMLLSYQKPVFASSGTNPEYAVDEEIRTWWSAENAAPGETLTVDLEKLMDVRAIQVNLADENIIIDIPQNYYQGPQQNRYIETRPVKTCYTLEGSADGIHWTQLEQVQDDRPHGYFEYANGVSLRYVRLTGGELPYGQPLRVSGLRIFGNGGGEKPAQAKANAVRLGDLDAQISWEHIPNAQGCNIRYGVAPDKLYMSWLVYGADSLKLSTIIKNQTYYICVDSFNENGVTPGNIIQL